METASPVRAGLSFQLDDEREMCAGFVKRKRLHNTRGATSIVSPAEDEN